VWSDYVKQANDTTRELFDGLDGGAELKSWQRRWMNAIGESMEAYMRTPAFLEGMKQNTDFAVKVKRQIDDWTSEAARNANLPTAGDISGLFERLHSVEEIILKRLERIDERLASLEAQLRAQQPGI
jgi:hypothetical protein